MNVVFDTDRLLCLLKDFHLVTKLRVGVYDCGYREVLAWPVQHSGFCKIIRSRGKWLECCKKSDMEAFGRAGKTGAVYIYQCHAGLTEAVAPIRSRDETIGYLMFGQMRNKDGTAEQWKELLSLFASMDIDAGYLEYAFYRLHSVKKEEIRAYARILQACALSAWVNGYVRIRREDLPDKLERYISSHLDAHLSMDHLTSQLGAGKTTLCNCARRHFGMSVGQIIKKRRMEKAEELLKETGLSIASVADRVGIPDYNYFSKLFRSVAGSTPTDYRKKYAK